MVRALAAVSQASLFTSPTSGLTPGQLSALRLLRAASRGHYQTWSVAGPSNARLRAQIMTLLTGAAVPQAKAGVHAMETAFWQLAGVRGDCLAHTEELFAAWAEQTLSEVTA